jgi:hypothetical protein
MSELEQGAVASPEAAKKQVLIELLGTYVPTLLYASLLLHLVFLAAGVLHVV